MYLKSINFQCNCIWMGKFYWITASNNLHRGFRTGRQSVLFCLEGGIWSLPGTCLPRRITQTPRCRSLPPVVNGQFISGSDTVGSVRQLRCNQGYEIIGNSNTICLSNRTWTNLGLCSLVPSCANVPNVANGSVSSGNNIVGSVRQISCRSGFNLDGNSQIFCQPWRTWSEPGFCNQIVRCQTIPNVVNGRISSGNSELFSHRNVSCNSGFELIGNNQIFCLPSGQWSSAGVCEKVPQSFLNPSSDLNIYPELRLVGSTSNNAGEGFVLIKSHNGSWGAVSTTNVDAQGAKVVCRNLGFK